MFDKREKTTIAIISLVHFCLIIDFMLLMPLGATIMNSFSITAKEFGLLIGVHTFISGITGLAAAMFLDFYTRKKVLLYCLLGLTLSAVISCFALSYTSLLIARVIAGIFVGVLGSLILTIISDAISLEKRGTALGIVMSAFAFAAIIGIPCALFLSNKFAWNYAFIFTVIINVFCLIVCAKFLPDIESDRSLETANLKNAWSGIKDLIKSKNRLFSLAFLSALILGQFTIVPFLFPSIIANCGVSEAQLPLIYLCGGIVSIVASVIFGLLSDKWGITKTFTLALIGSIPTLYFITRMQPMALPMIILAVSCFYTFMGGRMTPAMTLITSTVTPQNRGKFMSLTSAVNHLAAGLAAIIASQIVVKQEDGTLLNFPILGLIAIGFSILAFGLIWFIKPIESKKLN
jgi:DHA1 family inner membrane transport protein